MPRVRNSRIAFWITVIAPACAWVLGAAYLTLRPGPELGTIGWFSALEVPRLDLVGHLLLFTLGGWLLGRAVAPAGSARWRGWLVTLAVVTLYGGALEVLQAWVPGRSPDVADLSANAAGVLLGLAPRRPRVRPIENSPRGASVESAP